MFEASLLKGKRILITGGGTGLGREMADKYLELGADLYLCGRRKGVLDDAAAALMDKHGGSVKTLACDIRNASAVDEMVDTIWQDGPLTGLVNNAAGNFVSRTEDLSPRGFDAIAGIVYHGTFYVTHAVGKRWIAAQAPGSVISITTTYTRTGSPYVVPSAMAKAAVELMTKSLAVEWGRHAIRLNTIAPGPFPTEGAWSRLSPGISVEARAAKIPMGRVGKMSELQNLAVFLMADGCDYLTGEMIAIDGGAHLANGATFSHLSELADEEWAKMREMIKATNAKDKAQRTV